MTFGRYPVFIVRSDRKTFSVSFSKDGSLSVRAPRCSSDEEIRRFLLREEKWIEKTAQKRQADEDAIRKEGAIPPEQIKKLAEKALEVIPERVRFYAERIGVDYRSITIRNQSTRWGSCGRAGDLNFNCLLMLAPPEVLDSVVVHELCHRKEMNHSSRFYSEIRRVFPAYDACRKWLNENGSALIRRMQAGQSPRSALASAK